MPSGTRFKYTSLSSSAGRTDLTINGSSTGAIVSFGNAGTRKGYVYHDGTDLSIANETTGVTRFLDNGSERMRIDATGNVLFAQAVRATITTDNDLSFDMNAASNFKCTPTAGGALTFTNITSGQTGNIILVNGSNYAITAAATTKVSSTCLATISATGTYWLSYYSDGTNVYIANTGALA